MCFWTVRVDPDEDNNVPTWRGEESGRSPSVGTQLTVQQRDSCWSYCLTSNQL